jgi:hypothetical protein
MKKMLPDEENKDCCALESTSSDCCQSTEFTSCCAPTTGKQPKYKSFVSAIIILAAIGVGANSIIRENSAQAGSSNTFSSSLGDKTNKDEGNKTEGAKFSFNQSMDSLQAIDAQAGDKDVVFIAMPVKGQELPQEVADQMSSMLGKLPPSCQKVGAYTLRTSAADYDRLVQKLEIMSLPCFVALGRQGSPAVIPADGMSEAQIFKAYLTASKGGAGCCSGPAKAICCPTGK